MKNRGNPEKFEQIVTAMVTAAPSDVKRTAFDVAVELADGRQITQITNVVAQTKGEAINRVKQMFVYSAERCK